MEMEKAITEEAQPGSFQRARKLWTGVLLAASVAAAAPAIGQATFSGSQIPLAAGTWSKPTGVAVDDAGDVFVSDAGSGSVVELTNISGTFASPVTVLSGLSNPSALAFDSRGNLYVSDSGNGCILMLPVSGNGFGTAVAVVAGLGSPAGMAFDASGNLFFADSENDTVMKAPLLGGVYGAPVVIGTGFNDPVGVAFDGAGDLFIADLGNRRVALQRYSAGTFGSPVLSVASITPTVIWSDRAGDLFIGDSATPRVYEEAWIPSLVRLANADPIGSQLSEPVGVAVDGKGNAFIVDAGTGMVLEVIDSTIPFAAMNVGAGSSAITYNFTITAGTSLGQAAVSMRGAAGKDFVAGADSCSGQTFAITANCGVSVTLHPMSSGLRSGAVEIVDGNGNSLATAFLHGTGIAAHPMYVPGKATVLASHLNSPEGVAVDGSGNVYVSDSGNNRILELPSSESGYGSLAQLPISSLNNPSGLAVDGAGNLYVASNGNDLVIRLPWLGNRYGAQSKIGTGLYGPSSVAVDSQGNVYIAETFEQGIARLAWSGTKFLAETGVGSAVREPFGVAVESNGNVLCSSPYLSGIVEFSWTGSSYGALFFLPNLKTSFPTQMATDGNDNLFILDTAKNQVIMLPWLGSSYGAQITVASGFNAPQGLAIDSQGALYVADTGNNQIVKIDFSEAGTLTFPATYVGSTNSGGAQSALVENTGNSALNIDNLSFPPDFPETSASTCAQGLSLAAAAGCSMTVSFTPRSSGGSLTESLSVSSGSEAPFDEASFTVSGEAIPQVAQIIHFPAIPAVVYGAAPAPLTATASSGLAVQYRVLSGPGIVLHSGNTYSLRFSGAGVILIEAAQSGNAQYQAAEPVILSVTVSPAVVTITPANASTTYGKAIPSFSYSLTGSVNGENLLNFVSGKPVLATTAINGSAAGSYPITASQGTLSAANYAFAFATGTLTINKVALQVSAVSASHVYGTPVPALTWTMSGFVNGDSAAVVTGAPALLTTAVSGSPVGTYPISISSGSLLAVNYSFLFHSATFTVTAAQLTVTAASKSMTYGQAIPGFTYTVSGYTNGDLSNVIRGVPNISTAATPASAAGTYSITCSTGTLSAANYSFRCVNGTLTVQKAPLLLTPSPQTMTYGSALPVLSYTLSGFVNGDTAASSVSGAPSLTSAATSRSKPGTYAVNASAGSLSAKNYSFSFASGIMTVSKAVLKVSAQAVSGTYGGALPGLVPAYSGFVNSDTAASALTGAPSLSTSVSSKSAAGSYPISVSQGTLSSSLYTFVFSSGVLTIKPATLVVKASPVTITYGSALPALTYAITGFVNGDTSSVVSGTPVLSSSASNKSGTGAYPITVTAGTLAAANYTFTLTNGTATVGKAPLTVIANNISAVQGSPLPALTYSATGFVNGDTLASATTGTPALSTSANMAATGSYPIAIKQGTISSANYQLSFANGVLTVTPPTMPTIAKPTPQQPRFRSTGSAGLLVR